MRLHVPTTSCVNGRAGARLRRRFRGSALVAAPEERQPTGATGQDDHRRCLLIEMNGHDALARAARSAAGRLDRATSTLSVQLHGREDGLRTGGRTKPSSCRHASAPTFLAPFLHGDGMVDATERSTGPNVRAGAANRIAAVASGTAPQLRRTRWDFVGFVLPDVHHVTNTKISNKYATDTASTLEEPRYDSEDRGDVTRFARSM